MTLVEENMLEAAFVFDDCGRVLYWHEPTSRTAISIDDSFDLWDIIWSFRKRLGGICHSHPWKGLALPSITDLTTFAAVEKGLGKKLIWPIVTTNHIAYYHYDANPQSGYVAILPASLIECGEWADNIKELRLRSFQ